MGETHGQGFPRRDEEVKTWENGENLSRDGHKAGLGVPPCPAWCPQLRACPRQRWQGKKTTAQSNPQGAGSISWKLIQSFCSSLSPWNLLALPGLSSFCSSRASWRLWESSCTNGLRAQSVLSTVSKKDSSYFVFCSAEHLKMVTKSDQHLSTQMGKICL